MIDEAIAGIVGMMREQGSIYNPPSICLGKVISVDPIEIKTGDLILYRNNLLMSDMLLGDYFRKAIFDLVGTASGITDSMSGGSGYDSFASHSHSISSTFGYKASGKLTFESYLKAGDTIVLMPTEDEQIYVALCKVV